MFSLSNRSRDRFILHGLIVALCPAAAAVSALTLEPDTTISIRLAMAMLVAWSALSLRWTYAVPAVVLIWLTPNYMRSVLDDHVLFSTTMWQELAGLAVIAGLCMAMRAQLRRLEPKTGLLTPGSMESVTPAATGAQQAATEAPAQVQLPGSASVKATNDQQPVRENGSVLTTTQVVPPASQPVPSLMKNGSAESHTGDDHLSDEELTQLLGRLDETLGLIRSLRAQTESSRP